MHFQAFRDDRRSAHGGETTVTILTELHVIQKVFSLLDPTRVLSLESEAQVNYRYLCPGLWPPGQPSPAAAPGAPQGEPLPPGGSSFPVFTSP